MTLPRLSRCPGCGGDLQRRRYRSKIRFACLNPRCSVIEVRVSRRGNKIVRASA